MTLLKNHFQINWRYLKNGFKKLQILMYCIKTIHT